MAKDNIYDLTISEIILRLGDPSTTAYTARLEITSSIGSDEVYENFNGNHTFTSEVINMPTDYSVQASSHVITTPTAPVTTTGSTDSLTTALHSVILGAVGATYVVTSTVILEHATDPDITLNATYTITSVLPIFYGIKAAPTGTPDSTSLSQIASSITKFTMVTSIVGRLYVAIPSSVSSDTFKGVKISPNGTWIDVDDFDKTIVGSYEYYVLQYDTYLTGSYNKTFDIVYENTVISLPNPNPNL